MPSTRSRDIKTPNTPASLDARLAAIEAFLQQLVFLLEVEPRLTRKKLAAWLMRCQALQAEHQTTSPANQKAFAALVARVLELELGEADITAGAI